MATKPSGLSYRACILLFIASTAFPVAAGLMATERMPAWMGPLDVAMAGVLVGTAMFVTARHRAHVRDEDRLAAFRASHALFSLIPVLLAVFFLVGDRVDWDVVVIGFAWRSWLLLYTLPYLIAARRGLPLSQSD